MLIFLIQHVQSTLHRGDNPYEILGVKRTATEQEIKKAYRDITTKHHPDLHKTKEDERIWVRASDAFDILKDPKRRRLYDQTGDVSDEPIDTNQEHGFHQGGFNNQNVFNTPEINTDNFDELLDSAESHDLVILLYNSAHWLFNMQYKQIYETVADEFKEFITFYHSNVYHSNSVHRRLNIQSMRTPLLIYVAKKHGQIIHKELEQISSAEKIRKFIEQCMNSHVEIFTSISKLDQWISQNSNYPRLICFDRSKNPPRKVLRASGMYQSVRIAYISSNLVECVRHYHLKNFPTNLLFHGSFSDDITDILHDLKGYDHPILARLTHRSYLRDCSGPSILYVGDPQKIPKKYKNQLNDGINAASVYCDSSYSFARSMSLKEGDFVIFSSSNHKMLKLSKNSTLEDGLRQFEKGRNIRTFSGEPSMEFSERMEIILDGLKEKWERFSLLELLVSLFSQPFILLIILFGFIFCIPSLLLN